MHVSPNIRPALTLVLALVLGAWSGTASGGPATFEAAAPMVEQVSLAARADGKGYVIRFRTTGAVSGYREPRWVGDHRLEIELFNVDLARSYRRAEPTGPIRSISEEPRGGHLIFRFDVDPSADVQAAIYRDASSTDVLVGLTYRTDQAASLPVPVRPVSASAGEGAAKAASEGERWRLDTIVIDPGHGGKDPGAVANGVREKDVTLSVARMLGAYIEDQLGLQVLYTRDDDRFIELKDRGSFANAHEAKLFVSLHTNAAADARAFGTETYFLGMHKSDAAKQVMERENEVVKLEADPTQYEALDERALIRQALLQSANMRKSEELAELVERQFEQRVGRRSRGIKQAGFYVLWGASMPAVLVELGFLTNPSEARFLSSEEGQAYMASAIFRAVRAYKEQYEKGLLVHSR